MTIPGRNGVIQPDWPAPARVRAASTLRVGGVSRGSYASLNLSMGVGDDEANVARNRRILSEMLNLPAEPLWIRQIHGTTVLNLDESDLPAATQHLEQRSTGPSSRNQPVAADGAVTSNSRQPCVVLTADCLPVLFCDTTGTRVAAAHAGWRGLAGGVLESAVRCMGVDPGQLLTWIGPGISQQAYEVGEDVLEQFVESNPNAVAYFTGNANGRWQADLYGLARLRLRTAGVEKIYGGGLCTHSDSERFFSHRREAPCGRMATLIWLN
ncbi:MAG: peptidoglycan editing factor PgeF [Rhodospirillaceae bacterium]|nr:peptidoglycan editing factor PgeF [Rhodospirillaceae bacterium]MDE0360694.1 peptidoglycan editing factor PgeF [Rhodospirillaceae bacterium]